MTKLLVIIFFIPLLTRTLVFIVPFYEKGKYGKVSLPRITFLFLPLVFLPIIILCLLLNINDFIKDGLSNKDASSTILILSICLLFDIYLLVKYKLSIIKFDKNKIIYRKETYLFSEIISLGFDKNYYYFVTKDRGKIRIDSMSPGLDMLIKDYHQKIGLNKKEVKWNEYKKNNKR